MPVVCPPSFARLRRSPYARFQLRRNPFGELTREERAELAVVDAEHWGQRLDQPRTALQFIGPCGHGKTTHLLAIQRWLNQHRGAGPAPYVYLPEEGPLPKVPAQRPVLIDEAQRLGFWQLRQALRTGGPLVLGTHVDLTRPLVRYQLEVITVDVSAEQSPERVGELLNRRIEAARLFPDSQVPRLHHAQVVTLLREFGSDIRRLERHLYDQFQQAVEKELPWPPAS